MSYQLLAVIFGTLSIVFFVTSFAFFLKIDHLKSIMSDMKDYRDLYYDKKQLYEKLLAKQKEPQERPKSIELQEFLTDLLQGEALISVQRVDNSNLFMYSPREK